MPVELNIVESLTELDTTVVTVNLVSASEPGPAGPGVPTGGTVNQVLTKDSSTDYDTSWQDAQGGAGGAPTDATYLVTTANGDLTAEVVVGATPGGELGGTWAAPTVDATHSGSSHASVQAAAEATAAAALSSHEADTTGVHGIADTSALALTANHPTNATFNDHSARHENGGADEISLAGLDGTPTELTNHLNDATDAHDASAISVLDTGAFYTATDVEAVLAEIAPQLGGGSGEAMQRNVTQATHGFSVGQVVTFDGASWTLAQADAPANAEVLGLVAASVDTNTFTLHYGGRITGLSGLAAGTTYYLSDTVAGGLTATEPANAGEVSKPLLVADSTTSGYFFNWRGAEVIDMATQAELDAHVTDVSDAHDASAISVADAGGNYTGTDVEAVLAEIAPQLGGGVTDIEYESRSTNTILGVADKGKTIDITATITQTFEADETLGDGWWVILRNASQDGTTVVTLNPDGSETIDGLTTVTMYSGECRLIMCNGAAGNFNSELLQGGFARFTADGSFVVPAGIDLATVECVGAGGGGGGGAGGAAGSNRQAGSGGGGGGRVQIHLAGSVLGAPGSSITVDVGAGGTSGAGGSSGVGSDGGDGNNTTFGTLLTGYGGGRGIGGQLSTTIRSGGGGGGNGEKGQAGQNNAASRGGANFTAGNGGMGGAGAGAGTASGFNTPAEWGGGAGGVAGNMTTDGNQGGASVWGGGGGGAGGGLPTTNTERAGGSGGPVGSYALGGNNGGGGTVGGGAGAAGAAGDLRVSGAGGAGGGGQDSGTGGAGGDGGAIGGGGGGGGGGTTTGGAGGAGGRGECRVWYS